MFNFRPVMTRFIDSRGWKRKVRFSRKLKYIWGKNTQPYCLTRVYLCAKIETIWIFDPCHKNVIFVWFLHGCPLNYRWLPIPHFSGIYFVCICEHICMTGYNELFLGKSIKIAINFYTKALSRNCVVIDYSFCQAARVVSEKTSFSCCTTHICKGLREILSHPWSIKIVKIEVTGFKSYIPTRTCSETQFQMLIEIPFRLL